MRLFYGLLVLSVFTLVACSKEESASEDAPSLERSTDLAALAEASDEGATIVVKPGIYRLNEIIPKNGQTFVGEAGAILNGARRLSSGDFVASGGRWVLEGVDIEFDERGTCDDEHATCGRPEGVFLNDEPLVQCDTLGDLSTGKFYFDYDDDILYLADNPSGKKVEITAAELAFAGDAQDVTIRGFIVEKYASPAQVGAIYGEEGEGWLIEDNEVRHNSGVGIAVGSGGAVINNFVHHNGHVGIVGGGEDLLIEGNEISYNNVGGFDDFWEGGGMKITAVDGLVVRDNHAHHNKGPGLWTDIDCIRVLYEDNLSEYNSSMGIFHEISYEAVIRNNIARYNDTGENLWFWGAGILIAASQDVEVYGNTVIVSEESGNGIVLLQQDRGDGAFGHYHINQVNVHDNTIEVKGNDGISGGVTDLDPGHADYDAVTTGSNTFNNNTYIFEQGGDVFSALKENLDQIMGTLQDGLVLFTRDTRVVLVSASAERFVGRPRGEILGNSVEGVFSDANKLGRIVLDAFALHQPIPQREIELENGQRIQIALDFIAERGERIGALLTMRDAESVHRIENEIELSRRMAAIGRLTSGVAHEVKNPINAIVVHLELLREKMREIDPGSSRHMDVIEREIHRLDRVVQTLVDFTRPMELRLADFDLRRLTEDVAALASPEAALQGVRVETTLGNEALPVRADADLIKQALLNVVLNGVQAMVNGGVLSLVARRDETAATIEVRDQGAGIAPDIRDKIFNLYFTTKKAGSGIGLTMSYRVMQLHNGALHFVTEMGQGTTFRLVLPLANTQEPKNAEIAARR